MAHTADEFSGAEWAAFWRSNERQIMNYTSIFKGTIRAHEWKAEYANYILGRQARLAPTGTLKVHTFRQRTGESHEPSPEPLLVSAPDALAKAIWLHDSCPWGEPLELPNS